MLKKAGIVVAAAAVGLLAVSPLAFAGESHGKGHGHSHGGADINSVQQNSEGLINVSDINANVPVNALNCNDIDLGLIPVDVEQITAPISGALALLGSAETEQYRPHRQLLHQRRRVPRPSTPSARPAELDAPPEGRRTSRSGALLFVVHDPKRRWRAA